MSARRDPTPKPGILAILNSLGRLPIWLDTQYPQSAKAHTVPALYPRRFRIMRRAHARLLYMNRLCKLWQEQSTFLTRCIFLECVETPQLTDGDEVLTFL